MRAPGKKTGPRIAPPTLSAGLSAHITLETHADGNIAAHFDGYSIGNVRPRNQASLDGRRLSYLFLDDNAPPLSIGVAEMRDARRNKLADAFVATCRELVRADSLPGMI